LDTGAWFLVAIGLLYGLAFLGAAYAEKAIREGRKGW
jgi:F0F1-type ATP synthase membrane subunit c/vacuolar-type H+-ATPase subunit K